MFSQDPLQSQPIYPLTSFTCLDGQGVIESGNYEYGWSVTIPVSLSWNLTLYTDFDVNFFLGTKGINSVKINGTEYDLDTLEVVGGKYVITLASVPANRACEPISVEVGYGDGYTVSHTKSLADYASAIFTSHNSAGSKVLIATAMKYIDSAYTYARSVNAEAPATPADLTALLASESYLKYAPTENVTLDNVMELGNASLAIESAQLDLASQLKFRFNLRSGYNGTLTVNGQSYTVENGRDAATGHSYVNLNIRAYALTSGTVTLGGVAEDGTVISGKYSLATYINGVVGTATDSTKALLAALSNYVSNASAYKIEVDNMSKYVFEKQGNSYVLVGISSDLENLVVPQSFQGLYVTEIAPYAFAGNTLIKSLILPDTVKTVGVGAFKDCVNLTSVTLGAEVQVLGALCFENTAITELVIPDSVQAIGQGALKGCNALASITLPFVGAYRSGTNNFLGIIFGAPTYVANVDYVPASLKNVTLSDGCTSVPAYSFFGCSGINEVVLGKGVSVIGISAFQGCSSLKSIYLPATVTSVPAAAFFYNSPFFGCADGFTVVTESEDVSSFGKYWCQLTDSEKATVVSGVSYEDYLKTYK